MIKLADLDREKVLMKKEILPMTTDYRFGHKTVDWIRGYNHAIDELEGLGVVVNQEELWRVLAKTPLGLSPKNIKYFQEVITLTAQQWLRICPADKKGTR